MELSHIVIDCDRAKALAHLLHGSSLKELALSYADIGDNEATVIAQPLHHNCTLHTLNLLDRSITGQCSSP